VPALKELGRVVKPGVVHQEITATTVRAQSRWPDADRRAGCRHRWSSLRDDRPKMLSKGAGHISKALIPCPFVYATGNLRPYRARGSLQDRSGLG
jgi:hypothetical protein